METSFRPESCGWRDLVAFAIGAAQHEQVFAARTLCEVASAAGGLELQELAAPAYNVARRHEP